MTVQSPEIMAEFLQNVQLFSSLGPVERTHIAKRLRVKVYAPREVIVKEGQEGDSLFVIAAGFVEIRKKDPQTGIDFLLSKMEAGACFGEMSLLNNRPRSATVTAVDQTLVWTLEQFDFTDLMLSHPFIGLNLSQMLAERLEKMSAHVGIDYVNLKKLNFDAQVVALIPRNIIMQHQILPIGMANNTLTIAMVDPNNLIALDDIRRFVKGTIIEPVVVTKDDFTKFMEETYPKLVAPPPSPDGKPGDGVVASVPQVDMLNQELMKNFEVNAAEDANDLMSSVPDLAASADEAPIVRLANNILGLAIKKGVSDIHLEPREKDLYLRFRLDGVLQVEQILPKRVQLPLISRFKIVANLDISERRLPQDGRISVRQEGKAIDFRVSTIPTKFGEKVCMRILDKSNTTLGLDKLFAHEGVLATVREMINQPYGIIFVTGPTGSGKTTTLYSCLSELNTPDVNISTAEDPIEYDQAGINQDQTIKEIGLDFGRILRAFLRQDPDIILVGETRDAETAKTAIEAALTGHVVFTTLHTNSAAASFIRLGEMGVENFLMASATVGIIAQRLCRRICSGCKEPFTPDAETLKYLGWPMDKPANFFKGVGCERCNGSGYKGRVGLYEVLRMNGELRKMVARGDEAQDIHNRALALGMVDLKGYALWAIERGDTTVEEVLSVVSVTD
ncbi:MAG: Flp pilus assembly complex ATPase component TadA [Candidatus Sericytochromatia bacterium]|nr:Flp pilus assembly complex ATPase component TadA [Candidatus Sericytochromatia bacterium]